MHLCEALLPRDEAIQLAAAEVRAVLTRNGAYYDRVPHLRPDAEKPLSDRIRADDTCYFIPFARGSATEKPMVIRVNGVTRVIVVDRSF